MRQLRRPPDTAASLIVTEKAWHQERAGMNHMSEEDA